MQTCGSSINPRRMNSGSQLFALFLSTDLFVSVLFFHYPFVCSLPTFWMYCNLSLSLSPIHSHPRLFYAYFLQTAVSNPKFRTFSPQLSCFDYLKFNGQSFHFFYILPCPRFCIKHIFIYIYIVLNSSSSNGLGLE